MWRSAVKLVYYERTVDGPRPDCFPATRGVPGASRWLFGTCAGSPALVVDDVFDRAPAAFAQWARRGVGIGRVAEAEHVLAVMVRRVLQDAPTEIVVVYRGRHAAHTAPPRGERHVLGRAAQVPHDR